jgi:hypothetical protein
VNAHWRTNTASATSPSAAMPLASRSSSKTPFDPPLLVTLVALLLHGHPRSCAMLSVSGAFVIG